MTERDSDVPLASSRRALGLQRALRKPAWTIVVLGIVALMIEVCQQWPEFYFPGHAVGEFVRNLAYALIGAVVFNWILIELPAQRRRRLAYSRHHQGLQFLVQMGPFMLAWYRAGAKLVGVAERSPDAWNRLSIEKCARSIYEKSPASFGPERRQLLSVNISAIQLTLDGMEAATFSIPMWR